MISLDSSIFPAIAVFLALIIALNYLLFQPLMRVQSERENRTSGLMARVRRDLDRQMILFNQYQGAVKSARADGYRVIEQARADAFRKRAEAVKKARETADRLIAESRKTILAEVDAAKLLLSRETDELARRIAAIVLQRPA